MALRHAVITAHVIRHAVDAVTMPKALPFARRTGLPFKFITRAWIDPCANPSALPLCCVTCHHHLAKVVLLILGADIGQIPLQPAIGGVVVVSMLERLIIGQK